MLPNIGPTIVNGLCIWTIQFLGDCLKELWRKAKLLLEQEEGIKELNFDLVLYGKADTISQAKVVVLWKMINSFKEALWKVRNKIIFNSNEVTVNECIALSFNAMHLYVLLDKKYLTIAGFGVKNNGLLF